MNDDRESRFLPPNAPYRGGALLHNLTLFGRVCRGLGMDVPAGRISEAAHALRWLDLGRREDVFHALRSLLVTRKADYPLFREAFRTFWQAPDKSWTRLDLRSLGEEPRERPVEMRPPAGEQAASEGPPRGESEDGLALLPLPSRRDVLRRKDFAEMSGEEAEVARRMISRLDLSQARRRSRRMRPGRGRKLDARRLLRRSLRHLGEPVELPTRVPKLKPRTLVLICDISGSMEAYTRLLLHFMHVLQGRFARIESFVFATRLSRITLPLKRTSVDRALRDVGSSVRDWGGGTRIGDALKRFNYAYSRRVLGWGAVVLLITDGWDRGDPEVLAKEAARLERSCHRFIWLNPLLGRSGYQPLTRGAQALLPHVDQFLPVHNLESLEALGKALGKVRW